MKLVLLFLASIITSGHLPELNEKKLLVFGVEKVSGIETYINSAAIKKVDSELSVIKKNNPEIPDSILNGINRTVWSLFSEKKESAQSKIYQAFYDSFSKKELEEIEAFYSSNAYKKYSKMYAKTIPDSIATWDKEFKEEWTGEVSQNFKGIKLKL